MKIRPVLKGLANLVVKPNRLFGRPIHAVVEPSNLCNLHCRMCVRDRLKEIRRLLTPRDFEKILDQMDLQALTFSGYGEPLLNSRLEEMIRMAKNRQVLVNTTTNGLLLVDRIESLLSSGIDLISVSLDAANPETYRELRNTDGFEQVIRAVKELDRARQQTVSRCKIRLSFVLNERSVNEVPGFLKLSKSLGADCVLFQMLEPVSADVASGLIGGLTVEHFERKLRDGLETARRLSMSTNLAVLLKNIAVTWRTKYCGETNPISCKMVWFSVYVTSAGQVRPCCFFQTAVSSFGNILEEDLSSILGRKEFVEFRRKLKQGRKVHEICRRCVPIQYSDLFLSLGDRF
ncbi:MAG: radical SAM protein [Deltaproteobacteria bacterium]|nr:radical SAM protein [Deltaproteobacteria bacterium]